MAQDSDKHLITLCSEMTSHDYSIRCFLLCEQQTRAAIRVSGNPVPRRSATIPTRLPAPPPHHCVRLQKIHTQLRQTTATDGVQRPGDAVTVAEVPHSERAARGIDTCALRLRLRGPRPRHRVDVQLEPPSFILADELVGCPRERYTSSSRAWNRASLEDERVLGVGEVGIGDAKGGRCDVVHERGVPKARQREER